MSYLPPSRFRYDGGRSPRIDQGRERYVTDPQRGSTSLVLAASARTCKLVDQLRGKSFHGWSKFRGYGVNRLWGRGRCWARPPTPQEISVGDSTLIRVRISGFAVVHSVPPRHVHGGIGHSLAGCGARYAKGPFQEDFPRGALGRPSSIWGRPERRLLIIIDGSGEMAGGTGTRGDGTHTAGTIHTIDPAS